MPWATAGVDKIGNVHINEFRVNQPVCTAVQLALVDLIEDWGIRPALVVGHGSRKIAAGAYGKEAGWRAAAWNIAYRHERLYAGLNKHVWQEIGDVGSHGG